MIAHPLWVLAHSSFALLFQQEKRGWSFFCVRAIEMRAPPQNCPPLLLVCIEWDTLSPQQTKGPCKKRGWRRWLQQAYGRLADLCIALLLPSLPPDTELSTHLAYRWASLQCKDHLLPLCIHPTSSGPTVPLASFIQLQVLCLCSL